MPVFSLHYLRRVGAEVFSASGAEPAAADVVAGLLADANAVGHDSHGVIRIPQYISTIEKGEIDPKAAVVVERETNVSAVLDGQWGFGQVVRQMAASVTASVAYQLSWSFAFQFSRFRFKQADSVLQFRRSIV